MIRKIVSKVFQNRKIGKHFEKKGDYNRAYEEYRKKNNYKKAAQMLDKMGKCNEAAVLYIDNNDIDLARRAIEKCFKLDRKWETFKVNGNNTLTIEDWLKENKQTQRFVRYVHNTKRLNKKRIPLIIDLAVKLEKVKEFKHAAQLYNRAFSQVNENIPGKKYTSHEDWLLKASECYSKIGKYEEAAECVYELLTTQVEIGENLKPGPSPNPYREYNDILKKVRDMKFLPALLQKLGDFDHFIIAYDLIKLNEIPLSKDVCLKYFGKVITKNLSDEERELRNKKMSYCLNQYIIYHRNRKEYSLAAEIALFNSQKKIASELYKLAAEDGSKGKKEDTKEIILKKNAEHKIKAELSCPHCSEKVYEEWDICPNCENTLMLNICTCGEKIMPHWTSCPACGKKLG